MQQKRLAREGFNKGSNEYVISQNNTNIQTGDTKTKFDELFEGLPVSYSHYKRHFERRVTNFTDVYTFTESYLESEYGIINRQHRLELLNKIAAMRSRDPNYQNPAPWVPPSQPWNPAQPQNRNQNFYADDYLYRDNRGSQRNVYVAGMEQDDPCLIYVFMCLTCL
eukprot:UN30833